MPVVTGLSGGLSARGLSWTLSLGYIPVMLDWAEGFSHTLDLGATEAGLPHPHVPPSTWPLS
jgi:hypothetical protein